MAEAEGLRAGIFIGGKGRFAGEIFLAACSVTQAPRYLAVHVFGPKAVAHSALSSVSWLAVS
jgi:hypothetical protein